MNSDQPAIDQDVAQYLELHNRKGLLRLLTCGSVDDGKSSLIGRLLYESKVVFEDQLAAVTEDSKRFGTRGGEVDLALLVDGLSAEREQGITIDVAYRFFTTEKRKYIIADTPGHEQYTRNMVTGASTADLAVILVDASKGIVSQTLRHSYLVHLLGIRHIVLAVNKMDLAGFAEEPFQRIVADYREFAERCGIEDFQAIPMSAIFGDNVVAPSGRLPWFRGPALLEHLDAVDVEAGIASRPFRMPVQWVNRLRSDFRGLAGQVTSGEIAVGAEISSFPRGSCSTVRRILTPQGDAPTARAGQSVVIELDTDIDVARGDVLAPTDSPPELGNQFEAVVVWMHEDPMLQGRSYLFRCGTSLVTATVAPIKCRLEVGTLREVPAESLNLNDIGVCELELSRDIAFEPYATDRALGGFILIDRLTHRTVGAGLLKFALRRSQNVRWQELDVKKAVRSAQKRQKACVIWLTGLSGAGKSTIANLVERKLVAEGRHTYLLDGDNVRHGLNKDLGFTAADRVENVRRVAEVSRLMVDAGLIVIVSFISPFRAERRMARDLLDPGEFFEVWVDVPLSVAEERDPKGLYRKARAGQLANFTGIDSPYEEPEAAEVRVDAAHESAEAASERIVALLRSRSVLA